MNRSLNDCGLSDEKILIVLSISNNQTCKNKYILYKKKTNLNRLLATHLNDTYSRENYWSLTLAKEVNLAAQSGGNESIEFTLCICDATIFPDFGDWRQRHMFTCHYAHR